MHMHVHVHVHTHVHVHVHVLSDGARAALLHTTHAWHSRCGRPLGPAEGEVVFTRAFEGCRVSLDCTNASKCVGHISFSDEPERALA